MSVPPTLPYSLFTDFDIDLFKKGQHFQLYEKFGSHLMQVNGSSGVYFAVWAPHAKIVSVEGDFNEWDNKIHNLNPRWDESGIWEGFIPNLDIGTIYKYKIQTHDDATFLKADPFANISEVPPSTGSIVSTTWYEWKDEVWMNHQHEKNAFSSPLSIYEIHLPSWKRNESDKVSFREITSDLISYLKEMHFTHVEFMPVAGYPYEPSWGYQVTGYFAVNSRLGSPQDLMYLIEELHKNDIGVILDWVPAHFPADAHGLAKFDGSYLYEHEDPRQGFHPEWNTHIFNFGRAEVRSFLISNALFWMDRYHADGLRVDAVTSMLYLDYARKDGEWIANKRGGNINLEALSFLQDFNVAVHRDYPNVKTIAEESTSFHQLTDPVLDGGVGFDYKWMMGWMHDTLKYFKYDFLYRNQVHHDLTFGMTYFYNEKHILPLSHDEVVHGKSPMLYKMFGDEAQKHANLRALYLLMFTHPGGKLLFMGNEFGQTSEWDFSSQLDWNLLEFDPHKKMKHFVSTLNLMLRSEPALYELNYHPSGMQWLHADDAKNSLYVFLRNSSDIKQQILVILNLSATAYKAFRIGLPKSTNWELLLNSDAVEYGGAGASANNIHARKVAHQGFKYSANVDVPALCGLIYKRKN